MRAVTASRHSSPRAGSPAAPVHVSNEFMTPMSRSSSTPSAREPIGQVAAGATAKPVTFVTDVQPGPRFCIRPLSPPMNTLPSDLFQAWLARAIDERGLSHAQLALRSGMDRSTVSRILAGERKPSLDTAIHLIEALQGGRPDQAAIDQLVSSYRRLRDEAKTRPTRKP